MDMTEGIESAERILARLTELLDSGDYRLALTCLVEQGWPQQEFGGDGETACAIDVLLASARHDQLADITERACAAEDGAALAVQQLAYLLLLATCYIGLNLTSEASALLSAAIGGMQQPGSGARVAAAGRAIAAELRRIALVSKVGNDSRSGNGAEGWS